MWTQVWDEYESCIANGISIRGNKAKLHETDINAVPLHVQSGNICADHHAGEAVIEAPASEVAKIRYINSQERWFQERMIQAIMLLPKKGQTPRRK